MKVRIVAHGKFRVATVCNPDGSCMFEEFVESLNLNMTASASGIFDMMEWIAENGLQNISSKWSHEIDKDEKLFELIKGRVRVPYFRGESDLIVVTAGGFIKKSKKTPKEEKLKIMRIRNEYFNALNNGTLEVIVEGDEDE